MTAPALGEKARSGLRWGVASVVAMTLFQLGLMAAMARLLEPAAFGIMAMVNVAIRLLGHFGQLGLGPALVQKPRLDDADVRLALGIALAVSLAAAAVAVAAAPLAGTLFGQRQVAPLVQAMALGFVLSGLAMVPLALLRRALRFRALAAVETGSYVLGYGAVGLGAAAAGWGVWSLVVATLAQGLLTALAAYALVRHPLVPRWRGDRRALLGYGVRHSAIGLVEFAAANLDTVVIARLVGEAGLGLYNRALLLATLPVEKVAGVTARVLFPVLSAAQAERDKVAAAFVLGLAANGALAAAFSLGMAAAADEVVGVLLGDAWGGAVPVLRVLALATPLMFMSNVCGVVCDALAWLDAKLRLQAAALVLLVMLMLLWGGQGAIGIAWAIVCTEAARLLVYLAWLGRRLRCGLSELLRMAGAVAACGALVAGAVVLAADAGREHWPAPATLGAELALGTVAGLLGAAIGLRLLGDGPAGRMARQQLRLAVPRMTARTP